MFVAVGDLTALVTVRKNFRVFGLTVSTYQIDDPGKNNEATPKPKTIRANAAVLSLLHLGHGRGLITSIPSHKSPI